MSGDGAIPLVRSVSTSLPSIHDSPGGGRGKKGGCVQSWTSSDTFGLTSRLLVFLDAGLVVMTMTGRDEYGDDGRYV